MDRDVAEQLYVACEKTLASLTEAEHAIGAISDEQERKPLLRALAGVIADVLMNIRAPVVLQHPDLEPPVVLGQADTDLCEEDRVRVAMLQPEELGLIDDALLAECDVSWRKVARVVGAALGNLQGELPDIPDGYYAQRVTLLVSSGRLEESPIHEVLGGQAAGGKAQ